LIATSSTELALRSSLTLYSLVLSSFFFRSFFGNSNLTNSTHFLSSFFLLLSLFFLPTFFFLLCYLILLCLSFSFSVLHTNQVLIVNSIYSTPFGDGFFNRAGASRFLSLYCFIRIHFLVGSLVSSFFFPSSLFLFLLLPLALGFCFLFSFFCLCFIFLFCFGSKAASNARCLFVCLLVGWCQLNLQCTHSSDLRSQAAVCLSVKIRLVRFPWRDRVLFVLQCCVSVDVFLLPW
jgi:hypothetical protein